VVERAKVVKIQGAETVVEMERSALCGSCRTCESSDGGKMSMTVATVPGISEGDPVELVMPGSRLGAMLAVFGLPIAAVVLGAVLGNCLTKTYWPDTHYRNLASILLALVFVLLSYTGTYAYERRRKDRGERPYIRQAQ
jgi:positive regulator of sigma E activity